MGFSPDKVRTADYHMIISKSFKPTNPRSDIFLCVLCAFIENFVVNYLTVNCPIVCINPQMYINDYE